MAELIVWYSREQLEVYHPCWDCHHRVGIHGEYLEIATVTEALDMGLDHCVDCTQPRLQENCRRVVGLILGNTEN